MNVLRSDAFWAAAGALALLGLFAFVRAVMPVIK